VHVSDRRGVFRRRFPDLHRGPLRVAYLGDLAAAVDRPAVAIKGPALALVEAAAALVLFIDGENAGAKTLSLKTSFSLAHERRADALTPALRRHVHELNLAGRFVSRRHVRGAEACEAGELVAIDRNRNDFIRLSQPRLPLPPYFFRHDC
jgi:hypothetical protein